MDLPMPSPQSVLDLLDSLGNSADEVYLSLLKLGCKGQRNAACFCPIAKFLRNQPNLPGANRTVVSTYSVRRSDDPMRPGIPMPRPVSDFISKFDDGRYPALVQA